jgi:hypothetical protein
LIFAVILVILTGVLAVARMSDSPDAVWMVYQMDESDVHVYPIKLHISNGQYLWRPAFAWNWIVWLPVSVATVALALADYRRWLVQRAARHSARKAVGNAGSTGNAN